MSQSKVWTCPTCATRRQQRFCPKCGEERLRADDLSLRSLFKEFLKTTSSVDGKLVRSWRGLLARPGSLTAGYIKGERRRYLHPLALFFIANAIFVAAQSLAGANILSSTLHSHLTIQDWSPFAERLVTERLAERGLPLEAYAPVFDRAAVFNAKALIILMALAVVPFLAIVFGRQKRTAGTHIVFALHLYAFVLIVLTAAVLLAGFDALLGGAGIYSARLDTFLSVLNLLACGAYLFLALPRVYEVKGWARPAATVLLTLVIALLFVGYRFAIFLISFYAT